MYSILLTACILLLAPVLFGISDLDTQAAAVPLEIFVSLIGIVLLTPVFQPEQDTATEDLIASKYTGLTPIFLLRILYSLLFIVLAVMAFVFLMYINHSDITPALAAGTIIDAIFLGSLGIATAALINHTAVAYMVPMMYYSLNLGSGSKLGDFYLFSMTQGIYDTKLTLFIASILLITFSLLWKHLLRKFR